MRESEKAHTSMSFYYRFMFIKITRWDSPTKMNTNIRVNKVLNTGSTLHLLLPEPRDSQFPLRHMLLFLVEVAYLYQAFTDSEGLSAKLLFSSLDTTRQSKRDPPLWPCWSALRPAPAASDSPGTRAPSGLTRRNIPQIWSCIINMALCSGSQMSSKNIHQGDLLTNADSRLSAPKV